MKNFLAVLCSLLLLFCQFPLTALADGNGNLDGGGGGMGQGTSTNFWSTGNDGVRATVVDTETGAPVSASVDFANRTQPATVLHFGKINKIQYRNGTGLALHPEIPYICQQPADSMPPIINSKSRPADIAVIKRYFCSEYACKMVADATGADYAKMLAGKYKIMLEPIAYVTFNGTYYCFTATEAALYDRLSGGAMRQKLPTVAFQNLPLALFLESADLGFPAWTGGKTGVQSNADIIGRLGIGIVWFDEGRQEPEEDIDVPDVEYRVDTDVITAVTLQTSRNLTPDNPASVIFRIGGNTYRVKDVVIPAGDSQVVWVKWHTPSTPQKITIRVSVTRATTVKDTFVAEIVDLSEKIPPDPLATDTAPAYSVPSLPNNSQKLTANWGVWSCYWVPVWEWHDHDDGGYWVDRGYWEYEYTGYSASISGTMTLMPDDIVPTTSKKVMKSGYGVKTEVNATLTITAPTSHVTYPQTAFSVFPEFQYMTYLRLLQRVSSGRNATFTFRPNEYSTYSRTVHFIPLWFPDNKNYVIYTQVWDTWTPGGMLSVNLNDYVSIQGSLYDDWYTNRE